jgi:hypothetical protein
MNQLVSRVPLFPVPGNGESDLHWYLRYHALAESGYRYAFRYGNAEFFMLDSNRPMGPGSEQYAWLDQALGASRARWKFVCHHHPVYSSDEDDYGDAFAGPVATGDDNPRSAVPLYEKYAVDVVFYGHIHAYERTWPMAEGRVNLQRGVRYVQTGGGGRQPGGLRPHPEPLHRPPLPRTPLLPAGPARGPAAVPDVRPRGPNAGRLRGAQGRNPHQPAAAVCPLSPNPRVRNHEERRPRSNGRRKGGGRHVLGPNSPRPPERRASGE